MLARASIAERREGLADPKRPVSLAVARRAGAHRQAGARSRHALAVRTAARHWLCPGVLPGIYEPRSPTGTVLNQVVRTHLERFLAETAAASNGAGVPRFIEREFRDFLGCGALGRGFARVRCDTCRFEAVLPSVPVRQWVLTVPHRLRYRLAFDHALCRAVLGVFIRAVLGWYHRRGRRAGVPEGHE